MAQNHVTIEIGTNDPLALIIHNKLGNLNSQSENTERPITIFRVPSYVREYHKNFYEPRVVSIGPYHRDREHLKCMEEEKLRYTNKLLSEIPYVPLDKYLEVLRELEPEARRCYHEKINMDSDQFIEMLFIDACFIIQLAMNCALQEEDDILYDVSWSIPLIKSDILMLENQIPFFVLQRIFNICMNVNDTYRLISPSNSDLSSQDSEPTRASLSDILVSLLKQGNETLQPEVADRPFDHLLDFYYHYYMSTQVTGKLKNKSSSLNLQMPKKVFPLISSSIKKITRRRHLQMTTPKKPRMIPCATELKEAGITFKKAESSIFHIKFSNGVLTIPYTPIEEATRPQLMNLIAFEQCSGQQEKPLTSYAVFMDCIVNTSRDVLILQQHGIIENKLADEKAAAEFFNQLRYCIYVDYEKHHLSELFSKVKKYCDSTWQRYRARLYRDYFNSPWSIISFLAAIMFLFLAAVQTLYSVLSYYHSSNSN